MSQYLPVNLFSMIFSALVLTLAAILGFLYRRVSKNEDCVEDALANFGDQLSASNEQIGVLSTNVVWIKESLARIESGLEKVRDQG